MRLRLADLLGEEVARAVTGATFHSVCARLLRDHATVFGRTERYTIYDQGDMRRIVDWLAKDRLLITHAAERSRRPTGGPSRFLYEAGLLSRATQQAA